MIWHEMKVSDIMNKAYNNYPKTMSKRTLGLYKELMERAQSDRSKEWFDQDKLTNVLDIDPADYGLKPHMNEKTVLVRRAIAIDVMLKAMTEPNDENITTDRILDGDLLLGVLPMGSNGLGKIFPKFMTDDEIRAGSITNRNTNSLFGHNTVNYSKLLHRGLKAIIEECDGKIKDTNDQANEIQNDLPEKLSVELITSQQTSKTREIYRAKTKLDFYVGVKIACQAVIDYAKRFAVIAEKMASETTDHDRRTELLEMARIAKKVPQNSADTFHEAIQSITFFHIALHASMNFISLGRLDQVLQEYLISDLKNNKIDIARAVELLECFMIKLAGRLNLSSDYLIEQDHVDYATVLGTHPYYIDQKAGVNNFLQNIIIGGKTEDGADAVNDATYVILQALTNVNLSTPGIYARIHKNSPPEFVSALAEALAVTKNNPAIINDEVMIPAIFDALMVDDKEEKEKMQKLANDYCVDGCWEPILNGKSDWTFTMFNAMTPLETALNRGASLSPDPELFRGAKIAPVIKLPNSFEELMNAYKEHLNFFVDQCVLSMFLYYMIDEYAAPSPLLSALLDGCMESGRDKAWGGTDYNLAGVIFGAIPNVVNTLAGIKKWVYEEKKYSLIEVTDAFRFNYICDDVTRKDIQNKYSSIQIDFDTNTDKFGNNDEHINKLTKDIIDICYNSVTRSSEFAKRVYQDRPKKDEWKNIIALRHLTGYYGKSLTQKFGENFKLRFTVGMGTFEQYNWQGRGIAACADRRSGEPVAPNFTPMPGTNTQGVAGLMKTFEKLELNRFAGGVITDISLQDLGKDNENQETLRKILNMAIENNAPMLTISLGSEELYRKIYETVLAANKLSDKQEAAKMLAPYAGINVRIGGWQTPFITLPISHMENYIHRTSKFQ